MANRQYVAELGAISTPISGQFLARNRCTIIECAFFAADLHVGRSHLVMPTMLQSAGLAPVNVTYAHHALAQEANRRDILRGLLPLVRPTNGNGHMALADPASVDIDDVTLVNIAQIVGSDRMLNAAAMVEAAK